MVNFIIFLGLTLIVSGNSFLLPHVGCILMEDGGFDVVDDE